MIYCLNEISCQRYVHEYVHERMKLAVVDVMPVR